MRSWGITGLERRGNASGNSFLSAARYWVCGVEFISQVFVDPEAFWTFKAGWEKRIWRQHTTPVFSVDSGMHTICFIVGVDAQESNYALRDVNLLDNLTIMVEQ